MFAVRAQNVNIDRDIVFTPNATVKLPGKMIYFEPNEFAALTRELHLDDDSDEYYDGDEHVSWLEPLKHALYLVLNQKVSGKSNGR